MKSQSKTPARLAAIALLGYLATQTAMFDEVKRVDWRALVGLENSVDPVDIERPSDTLSAFADSMSKELTGSEAREPCARLWLGVAEVLISDKDVVNTTQQVRVANNWSGRLAFADVTGPPSGATSLLDEQLMKTLGKESRALDDDMRAKAADVFRAAAWGASNAAASK